MTLLPKDTVISRKEGLPLEQLSHDAAHRPDVHCWGRIRRLYQYATQSLPGELGRSLPSDPLIKARTKEASGALILYPTLRRGVGTPTNL